jgi:hypothetical protein
VLFSGTIRSNLDPFSLYSDYQLQTGTPALHSSLSLLSRASLACRLPFTL